MPEQIYKTGHALTIAKRWAVVCWLISAPVGLFVSLLIATTWIYRHNIVIAIQGPIAIIVIGSIFCGIAALGNWLWNGAPHDPPHPMRRHDD